MTTNVARRLLDVGKDFPSRLPDHGHVFARILAALACRPTEGWPCGGRQSTRRGFALTRAAGGAGRIGRARQRGAQRRLARSLSAARTGTTPLRSGNGSDRIPLARSLPPGGLFFGSSPICGMSESSGERVSGAWGAAGSDLRDPARPVSVDPTTPDGRATRGSAPVVRAGPRRKLGCGLPSARPGVDRAKRRSPRTRRSAKDFFLIVRRSPTRRQRAP